jgi:hypothetical protein
MVSLSSVWNLDLNSRLTFDRGTIPSEPGPEAFAALSKISLKHLRAVSHVAIIKLLPATVAATAGAAALETCAVEGIEHGVWKAAHCSFTMDCERAYGTTAPLR